MIGYGNNHSNLTEPQSVLLAYTVSSLRVGGWKWCLMIVMYSELDYHEVKLHTGYESFPNSTDFALLHANAYITSFLHTQHQWERNHRLTSLTTAQFKPQNST